MILSRTKASHQEVQAYPVKNFNSYSIVSAKGLFFAGGISHNGPAIWRAERIETARWAVSAKEPACRKGILPDEASGQGPGTLARNLSRCKEGMAHFLPSGYKFY
jgi:hypothetical protein